MAKKVFPENQRLREEAQRAMTDWHEDRKEWSDRAFRAVMLVNAGGAVAATAFIGTFIGASESPVDVPESSLVSLGSFIIGLALPLIYMMYRFSWAEYRVRYLKFKRRSIWDADKRVDPQTIKTERPPTRPQLFITYAFNFLSLGCFLIGCWLGMKSLGAFC